MVFAVRRGSVFSSRWALIELELLPLWPMLLPLWLELLRSEELLWPALLESRLLLLELLIELPGMADASVPMIVT